MQKSLLLLHSLFFIFYNLVYLLPLLSFQFIEYSEGGLDKLNFPWAILIQAAIIYGIGITSFVIGAEFPRFFSVKKASQNALKDHTKNTLSPQFKILLILSILVYLATKVALRSVGVYETYSFDAGTQVGGIWSFSAFMSEILVFLTSVILVSDDKNKKKMVLLMYLLVAINILHGTRIFTLALTLMILIYFLLRKRVKILEFIFYSIPLSTVGLVSFYLVFLYRSRVNLNTEDYFTISKIFGPIVYESVFTQMSLVYLLIDDNWPREGALPSFFIDLFTFTLPRFFSPDKDSASIITSAYKELSPFGGFSGYASGLIYFGVFFFIFYFTLGLFSTFIYKQSENSRVYLAIYIYLVGDILYRITRDGYMVTFKALITAPVIILFLLFFRVLTSKEIKLRYLM
jgi:O-antigen polysaccharide polymerase Wzy